MHNTGQTDLASADLNLSKHSKWQPWQD